jgi:hypothetical protein
MSVAQEPVERVEGIDSWSINSDGSFQRNAFYLSYSNTALDKLFDSNMYWKAIEAEATTEEVIRRTVSEQLNLAPLVWGTTTLRELFIQLVPLPTIRDGQLILPFSDISEDLTKSFLNSLRSTHTLHHTIWPISGVKAPKPIMLGDGFAFRPLNNIEKKRLLSIGLIKPSHSKISAELTNWYGLSHTKTISKFVTRNGLTDAQIISEESAMDAAVEDFLACVSVATGKVATHLGGDFAAPRLQFGDGRMITGRNSIDRSPFLVSTNLDHEMSDQEVEEVLFAWHLISPKSKQDNTDRALANGIRRFHIASNRRKPEDQLVDLMIAAESIYLQDGGGEKRFRLSVNAALWADVAHAEHHQVFLDFYEVYDFRSKIVHGQTVTHKEVRRVTATVKARISNALKKFLSMKMMDKPFPDWNALLFPVKQDPAPSPKE